MVIIREAQLLLSDETVSFITLTGRLAHSLISAVPTLNAVGFDARTVRVKLPSGGSGSLLTRSLSPMFDHTPFSPMSSSGRGCGFVSVRAR